MEFVSRLSKMYLIESLKEGILVICTPHFPLAPCLGLFRCVAASTRGAGLGCIIMMVLYWEKYWIDVKMHGLKKLNRLRLYNTINTERLGGSRFDTYRDTEVTIRFDTLKNLQI